MLGLTWCDFYGYKRTASYCLMHSSTKSTYIFAPPVPLLDQTQVRLDREMRFFCVWCSFLQENEEGIDGVGLPQYWDVLGCSGSQNVVPLCISECAASLKLYVCWCWLQSLQEPAVSFQELKARFLVSISLENQWELAAPQHIVR